MKTTISDKMYYVLCLRIVPITGDPILLTHFPRNLTMSNGEIYISGTTTNMSNITNTTALGSNLVDLEGICNIAGVDKEIMLSGGFDNARCYLFSTTFLDPIEDEEPIISSFLGKTTLIDKRYVIEEMGLIDALNQVVGKTYMPLCYKTFGGQEFAGCKKDLSLITVTGTVTHKTSDLIFRDSNRTEVSDYFGVGMIRFTTGANANFKPIEIKSYAANGGIELFDTFFNPIIVGDAYSMQPGCRKRIDDCKTKWNNMPNFGGFPDIPTSTQYVTVGAN